VGGADHDVLGHGQAAEQADALQRAGDPQAREPVRSRESKEILPDAGLTKPHTELSSVVFPAPLGPMIPVIWRGAALRDTSSSAVRPPNRTVTPLTSRIPAAGGGSTSPASDELSFITRTLASRGMTGGV
jgi:hypothetical protein